MNPKTIETALQNSSRLIEIILVALNANIGTVRTHLDSMYESDDHDTVLARNLESWLYKASAILNEKVMYLPKDLESLKKDWQLKTGKFEKGEWVYEN